MTGREGGGSSIKACRVWRVSSVADPPHTRWGPPASAADEGGGGTVGISSSIIIVATATINYNYYSMQARIRWCYLLPPKSPPPSPLTPIKFSLSRARALTTRGCVRTQRMPH